MTSGILCGSGVFCFYALHGVGSVTNWYETSGAVFVGGAIGTSGVIKITWGNGLPGIINGSRSASICADPESELLSGGSEDSNRLRDGVRRVVTRKEDVHAVIIAHTLFAAVGVRADDGGTVG